MVDEAMWSTNFMFLKTVDKFNESLISAFVTAGGIRLMMLHNVRSEDAIRGFFQDVYEIYLRQVMNPFYEASSPISSAAFDLRVRTAARKHGLGGA